MYGVSIVSTFGHVETSRENEWERNPERGGREGEGAFCLFLSMVLLDMVRPL